MTLNEIVKIQSVIDNRAIATDTLQILEKKRFATWKAPAKMPEWYRQGVKNG